MEVPTIYKAYIRPIFQDYVREYPQKIWPYMVLTYLHQLDPEIPIEPTVVTMKSRLASNKFTFFDHARIRAWKTSETTRNV